MQKIALLEEESTNANARDRMLDIEHENILAAKRVALAEAVQVGQRQAQLRVVAFIARDLQALAAMEHASLERKERERQLESEREAVQRQLEQVQQERAKGGM